MTQHNQKELILTKNVYKEIFEEYYRPLCLFGRKMLSCEKDAEDIVHNIFLSIWERQMSFTDKNHLKAYLFQAVYNQSLTFIRRQNLMQSMKEEQKEEIDENNYLKERIESEVFWEIMKAIGNLPKQCGEVFRLSYIENLKISEVAERLQIAEETVRSQRLKARKRLREMLKDLFPICWLIFFSEKK